jgi:Carbohydrate family 9 binding domain-like
MGIRTIYTFLGGMILLSGAVGCGSIFKWPGARPAATANVPKSYVCHRAAHPIVIDGKGSDPAWAAAQWSNDFVDIEGDRRPKPSFRTRMKMLWDDKYLYVLAEMEEPNVWATLTEKNSIIYHDNDFEVFIDPDGDAREYYEFEMNALNTIWELTLDKPYHEGGTPILGTNLPGLKSAVFVDGTINNPADVDHGWSVEIAFPWSGLASYQPRGTSPPTPGDRWRMDFSRVEWPVEIVDGKYQKVPNKREGNWVWSPMGMIDMHRPERWGFVKFVDSPTEPR